MGSQLTVSQSTCIRQHGCISQVQLSRTAPPQSEQQHHPCDLIRPHLGQSILAAAELLNTIIRLLQPLCSPCLLGAWTSLPGHKQMYVICLVTTCPHFGHGLQHSWVLVLNSTMIRIRNETLCLRFHFQALSACGTCSLGFSSAAIFDGMQ